MSTYRDEAYNPKTKVVEIATWLDDYFGRHLYGVRFDNDSHVYKPEEVIEPGILAISTTL